MPFDGLASPDYEKLEKIDRVIDLIATPAQWCKGSERNRAGQYCIRGAMIAAGALETLEPVVLRSIHEVAGRHFRRIEEFNDHPRTTHGQVLTVLNRARDDIAVGRARTPAAHWAQDTGGGGAAGWAARIWRRCFS